MGGDGLGGARLGLGVHEVAREPELARLIGEGLHKIGVAVAEQRAAEAGEEVEVFVAGRVLKGRAPAAHHGDGVAAVVDRQVAIVAVDDGLRGGIGGLGGHGRAPGGQGGRGYRRAGLVSDLSYQSRQGL